MDSFSEGVHFNELVPPDSIGYRSVTGAISDIVAMGAQPTHILISLGLSRLYPDRKVFGIYKGIRKACLKWGIKIAGGDIVRSRNLFITVSAFGTKGANIRRSTASVGDVVFITDYPGLAAAGLEALEKNISKKNTLVRSFLYPEIFSGCPSNIFPFVGAMMDSSDGLLESCLSIARASGVAIDIESLAVPLKPALIKFCDSRKKALQKALKGGEDYYLVATASVEKFAKISVPVFRIGSVIKGKGVWLDGKRTFFKGFRHFS